MPYITDGNHITAPVGVRDVQRCLGSGSGDVGTLCTRSNINMRSAHKPVYMSKIGILTETDLASGRANAVSGYTISYGIKIRKSTNVGDYIGSSLGTDGYYPVKDAPWEYDRPVLDGTNVFRLTDFDNYWHSAEWAMTLRLPSSSYIYVPQQVTEAGQNINFNMNWNYGNYDKGWMTSLQIFGTIKDYYPSILMTCYYQGGSWNYAKSAGTSANRLTIGQIGLNSAQSGCQITINTQDILKSIQADDSYNWQNAFINTRKWTACWVLLPVWMSGTSDGTHRVFYQNEPASNITVARLQLPSPSTVVDRKVLTIVPKKMSYISSITVAVTAVRQSTSSSSGGFHRWNISSIVFTFEKETDDTISFVLKGKYSCQVGNAYGQGTTDSEGRYTISNSISVTGTGTKTVTLSVQNNTLASNTIWYDPTSAETGSNVIRFSGTLYLTNSTYGNWQGSYGIESQPSEPYGTLTRNINLT